MRGRLRRKEGSCAACIYLGIASVTLFISHISCDNARFRLTHETSFVKAHTSFWPKIPVFFYIGSFFRQFFKSVGKADYLALCNGFIEVHLVRGSEFDFQKYIKRSLEDDYKIIVGVR